MQALQAALLFAGSLCNTLSPCSNAPKDRGVLEEVVSAIVASSDDVSEIETLIHIARWETGGFRREIADCRVRGDYGVARGIFQIHPFNERERVSACSADYAEQVSVALFHLRDSVSVCKMHGYRGSALITIYTSGFCHKEDAVSFSHWGNGKSLQALIWTEVNQAIFKHDLGLLADATASEEANQSDERE